MDKSEIAMDLTAKAIDNKLIPYIAAGGDSSTIDKAVDFNAGQIANFYKELLKKLD